MFYDNFLKLCNQKGVAPTKVAVETGGHKSDATRWKNGSVPTDARKVVIAEYFGITVDGLMADAEQKEKPTGEADGLSEQWLELLKQAKRLPKEEEEVIFNACKLLIEKANKK